MDTGQLRAMIFERTGIAIDERDPIMAVLVASAHQSEEIGSRLLARVSLVRVVAATAAAGLVFALAGAVTTWYVAQRDMEDARGRSVRAQSDPRLATLLSSDEGRSAAPGKLPRFDKVNNPQTGSLIPGMLGRFTGRSSLPSKK